MAPRGFFTAKTMLHCLRRELQGELPRGFARAFSMLEWVQEPAEKRALLLQLVARHPDFAPGWKELSGLSQGEERAAAIEHGLKGKADAETHGVLLINKALILYERGDMEQAIEMLGSLAVDAESTLGVEAQAKTAIGLIMRERDVKT